MLMLACGGGMMEPAHHARRGWRCVWHWRYLALNAADSPPLPSRVLVLPSVTLTVLEGRTCCRDAEVLATRIFPLFYAVPPAVIGLMVM